MINNNKYYIDIYFEIKKKKKMFYETFEMRRTRNTMKTIIVEQDRV